MQVTSEEHSRLRRYAIVSVIGFEVGAVANVFVQELSHFRSPTDCTSTACFVALGTSLAGFVLMIGAAWGVFRALRRAGYIQTSRSPTIVQPGSGPEDDRILVIANELLPKFKVVGKRHIEGLAWTDSSQWYWININLRFKEPPHLILWNRFRGTLTLDEWRTLLSYYFVSGRLHLRSLQGFLWSWFLPIILLVLAGLGVGDVFGNPAGQLFDVSAGPLIGLWFILRFFPMVKETILRQDKWTAKKIGPDSLLFLFRKIDSLALPEIENAKRRTGWIERYWPMPTITERINNIQS